METSPGTPNRQTRTNTLKACQGCRQQKIKCNGESPCERCGRLALSCVFRPIARQPRRQSNNSKPRENKNELIWNIRRILRMIRVTDATTGCRRIYGSTSTVAFFHYIVTSTSTTVQNVPIDEGFWDGTLSIHATQYWPLISPLPMNPSVVPKISPSPPDIMDTVPMNVLNYFLERYINTAWATLPIQSPTVLRSYFMTSLLPNANTQRQAAFLILMMIMAIGCLTTSESEISYIFMQKARLLFSLVGGLMGHFELQFTILKIQYYTEIGDFEQAYSLLGEASGKVFAAGIHIRPGTLEERKMLQTLSSTESYLCITLGRPPFLADKIHASAVDDSPAGAFISTTFETIQRAHDIQRKIDQYFNNLWKNTSALHKRMKNFWTEIHPRLSYACQNKDGIGSAGGMMDLNVVLYNYAILVMYRPFILLRGTSSLLERNLVMSPITANSSFDQVKPSEQEESKINEGGLYAVNAARTIICAFDRIFRSQSIAKDLPLNSFFIENACLLLICDALRRGETNSYIELIEIGIHCLEVLSYQTVAASRLAAIRAALEKSGLGRPVVPAEQFGQDVTMFLDASLYLSG